LLKCSTLGCALLQDPKEETIKTTPINNKDIQSNKKVTTTELPFNVIIFQSIK
jgi:hypothetical protein